MNSTERHRRAGDSTPWHRSLPPLSLQAPNARQQGARQSNTLLLCGFPHQKCIHVAGGSVEEINMYFRGGFSYCESHRTRGKNCCRVKGFAVSFLSEDPGTRLCDESMVSATDVSRYSIADGSRNSLARRGGGGSSRVLTIHQANIHENAHIHKAQIVEGLKGLNFARCGGVQRL